MTFSIGHPAAPPRPNAVSPPASDGYDDDDDDVDVVRPTAAAEKGAKAGIITPGEVVTEDPQWMRYGHLLGKRMHS